MANERSLLTPDEIRQLPVESWELHIKDALAHGLLADGATFRARLASLAEASETRVYRCATREDGTTQLEVEGALNGWINIGDLAD